MRVIHITFNGKTADETHSLFCSILFVYIHVIFDDTGVFLFYLTISIIYLSHFPTIDIIYIYIRVCMCVCTCTHEFYVRTCQYCKSVNSTNSKTWKYHRKIRTKSLLNLRKIISFCMNEHCNIVQNR